ncbi:MAG: hypothetical protein LBB38_03055, partial [Puniceicoccales bacterium]|nr:hypothetical protein [Puniceicoccales bacterium]
NCAICHLLECSSSEETMDLADLGAIATVIQRLTSSAQHIAELRKSRMAEEKKSRGLDEESLRAIEERLNLL